VEKGMLSTLLSFRADDLESQRAAMDMIPVCLLAIDRPVRSGKLREINPVS